MNLNFSKKFKQNKMNKRKKMKEHGKIKLSNYFQEFKVGDRVAVVRELAERPKFPKQLQGRSGVVMSKRGSSYIVEIKDLNKDKSYIIHPVHLRKLKYKDSQANLSLSKIKEAKF